MIEEDDPAPPPVVEHYHLVCSVRGRLLRVNGPGERFGKQGRRHDNQQQV
jgi:hypothetical protein